MSDSNTEAQTSFKLLSVSKLDKLTVRDPSLGNGLSANNPNTVGGLYGLKVLIDQFWVIPIRFNKLMTSVIQSRYYFHVVVLRHVFSTLL